MSCETTAGGELRVTWVPPPRAQPHLTYDLIYAPLNHWIDLGRHVRWRLFDKHVHESITFGTILSQLMRTQKAR